MYAKLSHVYEVSRTGPPYLDATWVAKRLIDENPDAVLFGSDWPHVEVEPMPYDEDVLDLVLEWSSSAEHREKLFSSNPARLYGN